MIFVASYDLITGRFNGVIRGDGAYIPVDVNNRDWREFLVWNATALPPVSFADTLSRRVSRTLLAIRNDLAALTAAQKNNVWVDITSGAPPRWATDAGNNAAALAVLTLLGGSVTLSAADVLEAKLRGVAMYVQDNPNYLVHPLFDNTINVVGDQPGPV